MTNPPRPRDPALQDELASLHQQERAGHKTPKQQRRAERLERRLHSDEERAQARELYSADREGDQDDERARHRR
ncbi:MAG TPA: hypothetical protein VMU95_25870 [Trebonia sp.]|nr:hypothetical protein [Trebonia sp.]